MSNRDNSFLPPSCFEQANDHHECGDEKCRKVKADLRHFLDTMQRVLRTVDRDFVKDQAARTCDYSHPVHALYGSKEAILLAKRKCDYCDWYFECNFANS